MKLDLRRALLFTLVLVVVGCEGPPSAQLEPDHGSSGCLVWSAQAEPAPIEMNEQTTRFGHVADAENQKECAKFLKAYDANEIGGEVDLAAIGTVIEMQTVKGDKFEYWENPVKVREYFADAPRGCATPERFSCEVPL